LDSASRSGNGRTTELLYRAQLQKELLGFEKPVRQLETAFIVCGSQVNESMGGNSDTFSAIPELEF
jgi:hypothetical protein